ncbi:baseplate wedge and tail pin protein [Pantoea phage Phynn]|nr:baseplate wedge and tail pin protein [Pantoea phage Phynn]
MTIISKTREGAKVASREADFLQYNPGSKDPVIGGKRPIGGANVDQTRKGVDYANVQSAIDDLYSMKDQMPINAVLTTTDDFPPTAVQQVETLTFSGEVINPNPDYTFSIIEVYGIPFRFENNTNASSVCEAVYNKFNEMAESEQLFDLATRKGTEGEILEVRFIDSLPHPVTSFTSHGVTVEGTIDVQARAGYGTWSKLGESDLPVDPAVHVYYFKRIA